MSNNGANNAPGDEENAAAGPVATRGARENQFNKELMKCSDAIELANHARNGASYDYASEEAYQQSIMSDLGSFVLPPDVRDSIDVIVYNQRNNDGLFAAAVVYHYLTHKGTVGGADEEPPEAPAEAPEESVKRGRKKKSNAPEPNVPEPDAEPAAPINKGNNVTESDEPATPAKRGRKKATVPEPEAEPATPTNKGNNAAEPEPATKKGRKNANETPASDRPAPGTRRPYVIRMTAGYGSIERVLHKLRGKNVIMLDLLYKQHEYEKLKEAVGPDHNLIIVDDHGTGVSAPLVFSGAHKHGACAYTWGLFYPGQSVPMGLILVDLSDSKKHAKFGLASYNSLYATAVGYRYKDNPFKGRAYFDSNQVLDDIWGLMTSGSEKVLIVIGSYFNEVQENLKEQIARNYVVLPFMGKYKVGALNFSSPALSKRVVRQILSNAQRDGKKIDFAVIWTYEHNKDTYRMTLVDDHRQTAINMADLASEIAKMGGSKLGGGGHPHEANVFFKRDKLDIWDLFK